MTSAIEDKNLRVAIIAGEASGDHLGGPMMREMSARLDGKVEFVGIGGTDMEAQGLTSLLPMSSIAVMGLGAIIRQLPKLLRHIFNTVRAISEWNPDVLVIIDCPEFSHRVAARVRARMPDLPVVNYVAPTVWAWRPGRAKAMRRYIDEVMAVLPFEPEIYRKLGGPRCRYVGHSAGERPPPPAEVVAKFKAAASAEGPVLAVMPGSRMNEISRLLQPFGDAVGRLAKHHADLGVIMPVLPHTVSFIEAATAVWAVKPVIVTGDADRFAAMAAADAAIVASGTATLELAIAGTPMVVGYRMERLTAWIRPFIQVQSIVLANLVHGGNAVIELFQKDCTGKRLAETVLPLLSDTPQRQAQMAALEDIGRKVRATGAAPSAAAAEIVLEAAGARSDRN